MTRGNNRQTSELTWRKKKASKDEDENMDTSDGEYQDSPPSTYTGKGKSVIRHDRLEAGPSTSTPNRNRGKGRDIVDLEDIDEDDAIPSSSRSSTKRKSVTFDEDVNQAHHYDQHAGTVSNSGNTPQQAMMFANTDNPPQPETGVHYRQRRDLVSWDVYVDQLMLLAIVYRLRQNNLEGFIRESLPAISSTLSPEGFFQHLTKVYHLRKKCGMAVPPFPPGMPEPGLSNTINISMKLLVPEERVLDRLRELGRIWKQDADRAKMLNKLTKDLIKITHEDPSTYASTFNEDPDACEAESSTMAARRHAMNVAKKQKVSDAFPKRSPRRPRARPRRPSLPGQSKFYNPSAENMGNRIAQPSLSTAPPVREDTRTTEEELAALERWTYQPVVSNGEAQENAYTQTPSGALTIDQLNRQAYLQGNPVFLNSANFRARNRPVVQNIGPSIRNAVRAAPNFTISNEYCRALMNELNKSTPDRIYPRQGLEMPPSNLSVIRSQMTPNQQFGGNANGGFVIDPVLVPNNSQNNIQSGNEDDLMQGMQFPNNASVTSQAQSNFHNEPGPLDAPGKRERNPMMLYLTDKFVEKAASHLSEARMQGLSLAEGPDPMLPSVNTTHQGGSGDTSEPWQMDSLPDLSSFFPTEDANATLGASPIPELISQWNPEDMSIFTTDTNLPNSGNRSANGAVPENQQPSNNNEADQSTNPNFSNQHMGGQLDGTAEEDNSVLPTKLNLPCGPRREILVSRLAEFIAKKAKDLAEDIYSDQGQILEGQLIEILSSARRPRRNSRKITQHDLGNMTLPDINETERIEAEFNERYQRMHAREPSYEQAEYDMSESETESGYSSDYED